MKKLLSTVLIIAGIPIIFLCSALVAGGIVFGLGDYIFRGIFIFLATGIFISYCVYKLRDENNYP